MRLSLGAIKRCFTSLFIHLRGDVYMKGVDRTHDPDYNLKDTRTRVHVHHKKT
jgi:hypothetical protein